MAGILTNFGYGAASIHGAAASAAGVGGATADFGGVSLSFPSEPASSMTTVYGANGLYAGSPPPTVGSLQVTVTNTDDSAYTYYTASPALIKNSIQAARSGFLLGGAVIQGVWCRGTTQATPVILQHGYRFDYPSPNMRLIRFDPGATVLNSLNLASLSPTYDYYFTGNPTDVTFNMKATGTFIEGWLSAPGHPDTPHVSATDATYATGRIGFMNFLSVNYWSAYAATWTT